MTYRSGESFEITTEHVSETPQMVGHIEESTAGYPKRDAKWHTTTANVSAACGWEIVPDYED